jgi:hypothetical protein
MWPDLADRREGTMAPDELVAAHTRQPFEAFTLVLDDGQTLPVPAASYLAHRPPDRRCIVLHAGGPGHEVIDLDRVVRVDPLAGTAG